MPFRQKHEALRARIRASKEKIRHIAGHFFIKRLVNIGATGYKRSWSDNVLRHHYCHFVDLGVFLFDSTPIHHIQSHLGPLHETTGIPDRKHRDSGDGGRSDAAGPWLLPRQLPLL